ncbi:MAG: DUF4389 domain-containing protein, partial [Bacteroidota bacterium]|nr:DUF4389 domain-containing protein [Bacteroidota bacterium]
PVASSRLVLLFRPLLLVPHLFWGLCYHLAASVVQLCSFVAIVITGRHPRGLWRFLQGYLRYRSRLGAYLLVLADHYPPFGGGEGAHPVRVHVDFPPRLSRASVFFRLLLMLPHLFYAIGFAFVVGLVQFFQFWTVLLLGRMAAWQFDIVHAWLIYVARIDAYMLLLVDEYPPFNGQQPRAARELFP